MICSQKLKKIFQKNFSIQRGDPMDRKKSRFFEKILFRFFTSNRPKNGFYRRKLKKKNSNFYTFLEAQMSPSGFFFAKVSLHIKKSLSFLENKTMLSQKLNCFVPFFAIYK